LALATLGSLWRVTWLWHTLKLQGAAALATRDHSFVLLALTLTAIDLDGWLLALFELFLVGA
jgi:hypothetical protein